MPLRCCMSAIAFCGFICHVSGMKNTEHLPRHWVVLRLNAMGDVALTTGVLDYWRRERDLRFTVVTRAGMAPLFTGHPAVERVVGLAQDQLALPKLMTIWKDLAAGNVNSGLLDLHGTPRSVLLQALWRGPVRRYPKLGFMRRAFLFAGRYTSLSGVAASCKAALDRWTVPQRYALALEAVAPAPQALLPVIHLTNAEQVHAATLLQQVPGFAEKRCVALHPYATHAGKAWPGRRWLELVAALDGAGIPWFVVGAAKEKLAVLAERDFTNRTNLRETCGLLRHAAVLVTGDSGPMHLASAVGTPVVAMFGPTTSQWGFFPQGVHDVVLEADCPCRPCSLHGAGACPYGQRCLEEITVERVMAALRAD